jgi:hypothetical protein
MTLTRAALVAALATIVFWLLKDVSIATAGGLGKSPLEGPLFLLGLLSCTVGGVLVGIAYFARRGVGWRVLGAVGVAVGLTVLAMVVQAVVQAVQPAHPGWAYAEVNLWVMMLALLALCLDVRRRSTSTPDERHALASAR